MPLRWVATFVAFATFTFWWYRRRRWRVRAVRQLKVAGDEAMRELEGLAAAIDHEERGRNELDDEVMSWKDA